MTNKFVIIGASAAVIIAIVVVLAFIQNQNDRAVAQKMAKELATRNMIESICDATSNYMYHSFSQGRDILARNITKYYDCIDDAKAKNNLK
jgi:hypothetical protein